MFKAMLRRFSIRLARNDRREVDAELEFHLEEQTRANISAGMSPKEAKRHAAIGFGGVERAREQCREQRPGYFLETVGQDVRYALRGVRHAPGFSATLILTLMLGIGATTAVFSFVDRILFRSLPYVGADRLVSVGLIAPIMPEEFMLGGSYFDWRDNQTPFEALTSETGVSPCDLTEERPARLNCASVEATFLPTLGIRPALGRSFTKEEDRPGAPRVALISYALWQRRFNRDEDILNELISLDGRPVRVIGVLPKNFEMPNLEATDVVVPQALDEAAQRKASPGGVMYAFARLKPGVSVEQVKSALQPVFDYSLSLAPPAFRKEVHLQVRSLRDRQMREVRPVAWVLLGVVTAVLLIVCANVSSLLMARGAGREREFALRSALGASRARMVRQTLTEALVLSVAGSVAGLVLAELLLHLFIAVAPDGLPFLDRVQIDGRIICFTAALSFLCAIVYGIVPALYTPHAEALAGRMSTAASRTRLRQSLVTLQIAASMVLLVAGGLLSRSFWKLENQQLGMRTERVVTARISLGQKDYATSQRQMAFFQQLRRRLQFGPGVSVFAMADSLPPGGYHRDQIYAPIVVAGRPKSPGGTGGLVTWRWVTPGYFRALEIPILQGAGFTEDELTSSSHFVVLSKSLAARLFPEQDPIGQRLQLHGGAPDDPFQTVVGVAADVKNAGLAGDDEPEFYRLRRDAVGDWDDTAVLIVKTTLPADVIEEWLRSQVARLDPVVPVEVSTLSESVSKLANQPRFQTILVGFFAAIGLVLAIVGLYGVISFLVKQRTQEIGVRMALGASREAIMLLVLGKSLRLIACGVLVGLVAAVATSRLLSSLLFGIGAHDLATFAAVTALLAVVAVAASLVPASSAMKIEPVEALRCE